MNIEAVLIRLIPLLALAVFLIYLGLRLKMPTIIGFLMTGVAVGPNGFGILPDSEMVSALAELGVILLLFTIGLEFSIKSLLRMKRVVLMGGGLQMGLCILISWPLALLAPNIGVNSGFLIACLTALSSTAIVLKLFQEKGEMDSPHGRGSLGVLIFQDLAVVPLVLILPFLAGQPSSEPIYFVFLKVIGLLIAVSILSVWVVPKVMLWVSQTRSNELFLFTIAFFCLGTALLTDRANLSLALGAFLAGLIIAGSPYAYQAISSVLPMRDIFTSFFFVSIGMLMNLKILLEHPFLILGLSFSVIILNIITTFLAMRITGLSPRVSMLIGFSLCQIGEFAFVLAKVGQDVGLLNEYTISIFLNVAIITMALTPLTISLGKAISPRFADLDSPFFSKPSEDFSNHAIVVGFGVAGQAVARASKLARRTYAVIDLNPSSVKSFREKSQEPLFFGDATSEHVLEHLGIHKAYILVITIPDPIATRRIIATARKLNPSIYILARARFLQSITPLKNLGANDVIVEEFEAALRVFSSLLDILNVPEEEKIQQIKLARRSDPTLFAKLSYLVPPSPALPPLELPEDPTSHTVTPNLEKKESET
ncbi:MAG: cation:proton antiporter [Deltaproteobacteria bacterium]|jgi:CPA2 family monovalent cation:H+ antiporter-2|nr:cation:proton antiporter [Deltaproteobacteria bacterium]